jgi:hypothetical protein
MTQHNPPPTWRRVDAPVNAYLRVLIAVLEDADRELAPRDRDALFGILVEHVGWLERGRVRHPIEERVG